MSLSRLALRLAAIEALKPAASVADPDGLFPTLAGLRVFDSRIDAIESLSDDEKGAPIAIVYTETTKSSPYDGSKHRPDEHFVDLVIEALMAFRSEVEVTSPDGTTVSVGGYETPITDRESEAILDVHEALIRRVFDRKAAVASASLFFRVAMEVRSIDSEPLRDSDKTTRLAQRTIRFACKVKGEAWAPPAIAAEPPVGLQRLPEPLQMVALALPDGSAGRAICDKMAGLIPEAGALISLSGIDFFVAANRTPTAADFDVRARVDTA